MPTGANGMVRNLDGSLAPEPCQPGNDSSGHFRGLSNE